MKILHLSDLHLGKRVNEFSMMDDQRHILKEITEIAVKEAPDCMIIAGDVYDKSVPSAEAVELMDEFLTGLAAKGLKVLIISGNHDSQERLAFGNRLMEGSGIMIAGAYKGIVPKVTLTDEYGEADVWLLPFIKPVHVKKYMEEEAGEDTEEEGNSAVSQVRLSYSEAIRYVVDHMEMDKTRRNILVTHQFVTGALRSDSEEVSVGGTDGVDRGIFKDFDYVALGHIHGPQNLGDPELGAERIRYCGTPLKYSFSEAGHIKSVTLADLGPKKEGAPAELKLSTVPLKPLHDMKEIRGTYEELAARSFYEGTTLRDDYVHITLTDEEDVVDAMARLRTIYRNLMKLDYDNTRTRMGSVITGAETVENRSPLDLFEELYTGQNGSVLTDEQKTYMQEMIEHIWEGRS